MSTEVGNSYLDELNEIQRNAVTCLEGPVMVIAGPGSGKTRVLTYRIAHLVNTGVAPWQILNLTFTNKAAREMKDRIENVVGSKARKVWAGTFHSIFSRILRVEAHHIGYPNDFTIYDTDDSKSLLKEIIKSMSLDPKTYVLSAVRSRISMSKSNLVTPKAYVNNAEMISYDKMNRRPMMYMIYQKYVERCKRAGAMDFDDLLLMMFKLLYQHPDIRAKYQSQFRYIMIDEFQDTNSLQYEIIKLLVYYENSPYNVCIVGDDAQSIYSFRGATIENILQFQKDFPSVQIFKLEQNYRSTKHIVAAANHLIDFNSRQIKKTIWTKHDDGQRIKIIRAMTDREEGRRIADSIVEMKTRNHLYNKEIAILYRTNGQSRVFEEQLRRYNITYRIYGGLSFYQRKEVKDLLAYIRLTINPKDDEALKRIINYPRRGIGKVTISRLADLAEELNISMYECLSQIKFSGKAKVTIGEFMKMIEVAKKKANQSDAYDAASYLAKASGILTQFKSDDSPEGISRLDNLNALLDGIKDFSENDEIIAEEEVIDKSLATYIQSIALLTDADTDEEDQDVVTLMSIHASKGLEFKCIYIVGLEENLFPSFMSLSSPDQIEEERRLFYVAVTRAEQYLTLSYCKSRYQYGEVRENDPSRFLEEIPNDSIENISIVKPQSQPFGSPKLMGNFKTLTSSKKSLLKVDSSKFKASPMSDIQIGKEVLHIKFGEGKVIDIDNRDVATIYFKDVKDVPEKRIMLRFAKLQVLD